MVSMVLTTALLLLAATSHVTCEMTNEQLTSAVQMLTRQLMMQELFTAERIRAEGMSGIRQLRLERQGTRSYYADSFNGFSAAAIHDHANNIRTVGMGEVTAVLNGVDFRTRHNDYYINQPGPMGSDYMAVENIEFPDVPPEVSSLGTVEEQINEMRAWFKAWQDQDYSERDYRHYFKPILCYLEGVWTLADQDTLGEIYYSDRHFLDAASFTDLHNKIRFTSYTGTKSHFENYAFIPTSIINIGSDGVPVYAQWNYRVVCHPLSRDLPLNRFRVIDDLAARMGSGSTMAQHASSRSARFQINPLDTDAWADGVVKYGLLDKLVEEIPGLDNYGANLEDNSLGSTAYTPEWGNDGEEILNAANYHRRYRTLTKDANGVQERYRGYADENLFTAMNTRPEVANVKITVCEYKGPKGGVEICTDQNQKMSYLIPLEITYLSPLAKWNPYDLAIRTADSDVHLVDANGRNGGLTTDTAYDGIRQELYFQTPAEFYSDREEVNANPADTSGGVVGVLDKDGVVRLTRASGVRVYFPSIGGESSIRQRYPIMPIHDEGSAVWKEMEALKDILLEPVRFGHMHHEEQSTTPTGKPLILQTGLSTGSPPHFHNINLTADQVERLDNREQLRISTESASSHFHDLVIKFSRVSNEYVIVECDNSGRARCSDGHEKELFIAE